MEGGSLCQHRRAGTATLRIGARIGVDLGVRGLSVRLQRLRASFALIAMVACLSMTAQAADTTLTLACQGSTEND
jgi:hypothetical protein